MADPDRISYTYGFKIPGSEDYSSVNASISYTSDVQADETPEVAIKRIKKFVKTQCAKELARAEENKGQKRKGRW
jgi:hypothetical protein